jgi:hypothetical protein
MKLFSREEYTKYLDQQNLFLSRPLHILKEALVHNRWTTLAEMKTWNKPITELQQGLMAENMRGAQMCPRNYVRKICTDFFLHNTDFFIYYKEDPRRPVINFFLQKKMDENFEFHSVASDWKTMNEIYKLLDLPADRKLELSLHFGRTLQDIAACTIMGGPGSTTISGAISAALDYYAENPMRDSKLFGREGEKQFFYKGPLMRDTELLDTAGENLNNIYLVTVSPKI